MDVMEGRCDRAGICLLATQEHARRAFLFLIPRTRPFGIQEYRLPPFPGRAYYDCYVVMIILYKD